jgi:hypothetical protein
MICATLLNTSIPIQLVPFHFLRIQLEDSEHYYNMVFQVIVHMDHPSHPHQIR